MWLDSSVGRAVARYAIGPRFDSSFGHFLFLRSVVILSRWADVGCEIFPSLTIRYLFRDEKAKERESIEIGHLLICQ